MKPMMICGCAANAIRKVGDEWVDCCTIHDTIEQTTMPDLTGRMATCSCGRKEPSNPDKLAFFEYRGDGSRRAQDQCTCGYTQAAHAKPHVQAKCEGFTPRGPFQYDSYYCGCRGWD